MGFISAIAHSMEPRSAPPRGMALDAARANETSPFAQATDSPSKPARPHIIPAELQDRIPEIAQPAGLAADRFRLLRMRLNTLRAGGEQVKRLLLTSPLPRDGKTTVAANLAATMAGRGDRPVLLIDCDLRHATLTARMGLGSADGFGECLEQNLDPASALRRLEPSGCFFLPAGRTVRNPTDLLQTERLARIMQALHDRFDWILMDSPPVLPLTDALLLSQHAQAVLLIARASVTPSKTIEEAIRLLGRDRVAGIVLNEADDIGRAYGKLDYYRGASDSGQK